MASRIPRDFQNVIEESGTASSNEEGIGIVYLTMSHYPNVNIIISSIMSSCNSFLLTKSSSSFTFGTSTPNSEITYKVISAGS